VDALLTGGWPEGARPIHVIDQASVSAVREAVRGAAAGVGMARDRAESLVAAASELAQNHLSHATRGEALVRAISRRGTAGVEVLARDRGPGIPDPSAALRGQGGARGGLGVGLSAASRLADELDFDVRWGEGTEIRARKFVSPIPRSEVAILGRPCAGETVIGDDALFVRGPDDLLCAVADGLGHGPLARVASAEAMATLRRSSAGAPVDLLERCWGPLAPTRGAVVSIARAEEATLTMVHAGVGNVASHLYGGRSTVRFVSTPGVVGKPGPRGRIHEQRTPLGGRHVLVMFTDGLSSRLDLASDPALLREPPLIIAHRLLTEHGRDHDDALVLVATV
jgi:anti-sigma regulatory factor (Ser/Thr protein kinase)